MVLLIIFTIVMFADAVSTIALTHVYKKQNEILTAQNDTLKDIFKMVFSNNEEK